MHIEGIGHNVCENSCGWPEIFGNKESLGDLKKTVSFMKSFLHHSLFVLLESPFEIELY